VRKWLRQQSKAFYAEGYSALVNRWGKCINVGGGYCFFFQVRVTYVLRFISIWGLFSDSPSYKYHENGVFQKETCAESLEKRRACVVCILR
jgi:hypothetical protein